MYYIPLVVAFLAGCASAPVPLTEPAPQPAQLTEYPVPLILQDGRIDTIVIEDGRPQEGTRFIFCKDTPSQIVCLASVNGVAQWLAVPKVAEGNQAT